MPQKIPRSPEMGKMIVVGDSINKGVRGVVQSANLSIDVHTVPVGIIVSQL